MGIRKFYCISISVAQAISLNLYLVTFCMYTLIHTRTHTMTRYWILIISLHAALASLGVFSSHVTARNCIGPYMEMLCHVFMLLFFMLHYFFEAEITSISSKLCFTLALHFHSNFWIPAASYCLWCVCYCNANYLHDTSVSIILILPF